MGGLQEMTADRFFRSSVGIKEFVMDFGELKQKEQESDL